MTEATTAERNENLAREFKDYLFDSVTSFYEGKGVDVLPAGPILAAIAEISVHVLTTMRDLGDDCTDLFVRAVQRGVAATPRDEDEG